MFAKSVMGSADLTCRKFFISSPDGGKANVVVKRERRKSELS